jgi:chromosome partitioning protein
MIITVCGEKGGTGKTTIATNLAAMRAASGRDVLLIDTDPQGSASAWALTRGEANIEPRVATIQKFGKGLREEVADLSRRYQDIFIDAGGRALSKSDVAVLPLQASAFDVWTLPRMGELIQTVESMNEKLRVLAVFTRALNHASNTDVGDAREMLKDFPMLPQSVAVIRDRIAFKRAGGMGLSVVEQNIDDKAIFEISQLYKEVFNGQ